MEFFIFVVFIWRDFYLLELIGVKGWIEKGGVFNVIWFVELSGSFGLYVICRVFWGLEGGGNFCCGLECLLICVVVKEFVVGVCGLCVEVRGGWKFDVGVEFEIVSDGGEVLVVWSG